MQQSIDLSLNWHEPLVQGMDTACNCHYFWSFADVIHSNGLRLSAQAYEESLWLWTPAQGDHGSKYTNSLGSKLNLCNALMLTSNRSGSSWYHSACGQFDSTREVNSRRSTISTTESELTRQSSRMCPRHLRSIYDCQSCSIFPFCWATDSAGSQMDDLSSSSNRHLVSLSLEVRSGDCHCLMNRDLMYC